MRREVAGTAKILDFLGLARRLGGALPRLVLPDIDVSLVYTAGHGRGGGRGMGGRYKPELEERQPGAYVKRKLNAC